MNKRLESRLDPALRCAACALPPQSRQDAGHGQGHPDRRRSGGAQRADEAPLKLEEFLPYRLNVLAAVTSQALASVYEERYGIGIPEWRVLVTLGQFGTMTGKAIGEHTHMHKTKVSRAVASLEKAPPAHPPRQQG